MSSRRHELESSHHRSKFTTTTGKSVELRKPEVQKLFVFHILLKSSFLLFWKYSYILFIIPLQHKNSASHSSHRGKSSGSQGYEQILTPIMDMSPSKERNIDQRKLRKAKSQVSFSSFFKYLK